MLKDKITVQFLEKLDLAIGLSAISQDIESSLIFKIMNRDKLSDDEIEKVIYFFQDVDRSFINPLRTFPVNKEILDKYSSSVAELDKFKKSEYIIDGCTFYDKFNGSDGIFSIINSLKTLFPKKEKSKVFEVIHTLDCYIELAEKYGCIPQIWNSIFYEFRSTNSAYSSIGLVIGDTINYLKRRMKFKNINTETDDDYKRLLKLFAPFQARGNDSFENDKKISNEKIDEIVRVIDSILNKTDLTDEECVGFHSKINSYFAFDGELTIDKINEYVEDSIDFFKGTKEYILYENLLDKFYINGPEFISFIYLNSKVRENRDGTSFQREDVISFLDVVFTMFRTYISKLNANLETTESYENLNTYYKQIKNNIDESNNFIDIYNIAMNMLNEIIKLEKYYKHIVASASKRKINPYIISAGALTFVLFVSAIVGYKHGLLHSPFSKDDDGNFNFGFEDGLDGSSSIDVSDDLYPISGEMDNLPTEGLEYITNYKQPKSIDEAIELAYRFVDTVQGDDKKYSKDVIAEIVYCLNGEEALVTSEDVEIFLLDIATSASVDAVNAISNGENYSNVGKPFMMSSFFVDGTKGLEALQALDYANNAALFQAERINDYYWSSGIEDEIGLCIVGDNRHGVNFFDDTVPAAIKLAYGSLAIAYNSTVAILYSDAQDASIPYNGHTYSVSDVFSPNHYDELIKNACASLDNSGKLF